MVEFLKEFGVHGFPFVCLLLDLSLNVYQFPKRHLLLVIVFGLAYLFLNIGTVPVIQATVSQSSRSIVL